MVEMKKRMKEVISWCLLKLGTLVVVFMLWKFLGFFKGYWVFPLTFLLFFSCFLLNVFFASHMVIFSAERQKERRFTFYPFFFGSYTFYLLSWLQITISWWNSTWLKMCQQVMKPTCCKMGQQMSTCSFLFKLILWASWTQDFPLYIIYMTSCA